MKLSVVLGMFVLLASVSAQEFPTTETTTLMERGDYYTRDFTLPVYVKGESTYEMEDWTVNVKIEPQVWTKRNTGKGKRFVFSKVLVHLAIRDLRGKITADFESYLNYGVKDCDRDTPRTFLFWDHAGEERADNAGETFDGDTHFQCSCQHLVQVIIRKVYKRENDKR